MITSVASKSARCTDANDDSSPARRASPGRNVATDPVTLAIAHGDPLSNASSQEPAEARFLAVLLSHAREHSPASPMARCGPEQLCSPAMRSLAVLALLVACAAPAAAQEVAQHDVVVLSVGGDAPESLAREARESVAAVLVHDGMRIFPEAELALRMPPSRLRACDSIACAWSIARELGVSMVAAVTTWQQDGRADSVSVSLIVGEQTYTATEELEERTLAEAAALAARGAQNARARAFYPEATALERSETSTADDGDAPSVEPEESEAPQRSLEEYVLPGILGVVGLALSAGAVYALMPEECTLMGPSGVCLQGHGPNVGLGTVFAITGGLSVAGAIVWLLVGGKPTPMGRIDVVLGPEGGGLEWHASF